jgi:hypothetical protein
MGSKELTGCSIRGAAINLHRAVDCRRDAVTGTGQGQEQILGTLLPATANLY